MTAAVLLDGLFRAIARHDHAAASSILEQTPGLATGVVEVGATRAEATNHFLTPIARYVYSGDTALHIAAAAYDASLVDRLLAMGADASARNRLGVTPCTWRATGSRAARPGTRARRSRRSPH